MQNKIVGYGGFKTYGDVAYPTIKQGKQLQLSNKVWESTARQADHRSALQNFNNAQSVYKNSYLQNSYPQNYHPEHVPKGGARTLDFSKAGSIKAYDKEEARRYGNTGFSNDGDERKNKFLHSGTEHWKSNYSKMNEGPNFFKNSAQSNLNGNPSGFSENPERSNSVGGKNKLQLAEEAARSKSYKHRPYINNAKVGCTDYKFNYGEKLGTSPQDLLTRVSVKQPLRDNPLKKGTNQLWTEIPNYQGFKPSELPFKTYEKKIEERRLQEKGNLKLQVTQNFLVQAPGYGGYKPSFENQSRKLRQNCIDK